MGIERVLVRARTALLRLEPAEALAAAHEPRSYLVDIRPEFQRRAGEIPGAIVVERNHLEWRLDPSSNACIPEAVDAGIRWIILCEGGFSSSLAAAALHQLGLRNSTDVAGGFQAWLAAGLPVDHPRRPVQPRGPGQGPLPTERPTRTSGTQTRRPVV